MAYSAGERRNSVSLSEGAFFCPVIKLSLLFPHGPIGRGDPFLPKNGAPKEIKVDLGRHGFVLKSGSPLVERSNQGAAPSLANG